MNNEKLKELFENEAFVKELGTKASVEDAQALFVAHGAEISVDELKALRIAVKQEAGEELSEEELELVAGGAIPALPIVIGLALVGSFAGHIRNW